MCGISGIMSSRFNHKMDRLKSEIQGMTNQLKRRGPDNFGFWCSNEDGLLLGHSRLSIFDTSSLGNQPMISRNERYVISYNGEIYNFKKLKIDIEKKFNFYFKSASDSEVLLESISFFGLQKTLKKVAGMYAFSLWDRKEKKLYLVADPLSKKPLYWGIFGNHLIFGSEIKSVAESKFFKKKINTNALSNYLKFSYIKHPLTIFENLFKIEPGTYLCFNKNLAYEKKKYWNPIDFIYKENSKIKSFEDIKLEINDLLELAVKERVQADVPLGVMLSGGIDSSLITAFAQKVSDHRIKTFSVGFKEKLFDESSFSKKISCELDTNHKTFFLDKKSINDIIYKIPEIYDEPFADSSQIPTFLICNEIKKYVTVVLSGDGGDEVFGGYSRYIWANHFLKFQKIFGTNVSNILSKLINLFPDYFYDFLSGTFPASLRPADFGHRIKKIAKILNSQSEDEIYYKLISNSRLNGLLKRDILKHGKTLFHGRVKNYSFTEKMQLHDLQNYLTGDILVKVDRASMFNSMEVRSPFLDKRIIEYTLKNLRVSHKINKNKGKLLSRSILNDYLPKKYFDRPKMGFALPVDVLLKNQLKETINNYFSKSYIENQNIFDKKKIDSFMDDYFTKGHSLKNEVWNLFIFQLWYEKWM